MPNPLKSTCPYCGVGCGVLVTKQEDGSLNVKGDPDHPANFGRLCSKGSALGDTVSLDGRILKPKIHGRETDWAEASETVAQRFKETVEKYGPNSVAFYVSGQLLSEDYYVANKLIKGFIGTSNIDTNSRLCMSSSVAGHKRAFGSDTVPQNYEDLEKSDLVVLVGSNLAWCHPVLFQRLKAAKQERGTKVVVIDPRKTATCEIADLHLAISPGTDVLLFNGLLAHLHANGAMDIDYVGNHINGLDEALEIALSEGSNSQTVAQKCGLCEQDLLEFFNLFLKTEKTLTVYSQGVNQSSQGSDKVNAIINCHLFSGRIGKIGCGPLSVTGQPNAMGGREVGGLANMLAAHMDFTPEDIKRVSRFWNAANMSQKAGLKAVDMFDAVERGDIKAIWIMATNPAVSLPNANKVRSALEKCDFVVVSDCVETDTTQFADVVLPAATWGERNGTVTNSERRISRQRQILDLPGDALPDWKIITHVAQAMGFENAFPFETSYDVFKEHVALSAYENNGRRDFDLSGWKDLSRDEFDNITPTQWPVSDTLKERFFADGKFYTASGKANMLGVRFKKPQNATDQEYPYILNTGRIRDQWHTMTRTGRSTKLSSHIYEPYLEIHPETADQEGLKEQDLIKVTSHWGEAILRVKISPNVKPSEPFMPMHWSDQNTALGVVGRLVNPVVDPVSGQPESKHTPIKVEAFKADWHGLLITRREIDCSAFAYWTRTQANGCYVYDLAGIGAPSDWNEYATVLLGRGELLSMQDQRRAQHRYAVIQDNRARGVLFVGANPQSIPSRGWVTSLFEQSEIDNVERISLLSAKPAGEVEEKGPIVCSCFNVGMLEIQRAILAEGFVTPAQVGKALQAGTNCGSCLPEIQDIIEKTNSYQESQSAAE